TLTSASNTVELAEAVLNTPGTGNGGDLSAGSVGTPTVINFGNVWTKSPFEDVVFELLLDDGTIIRPGTDVNGRAFNLTYTNGDAYHLADFNVNGTVDINDWRDFKAAYGSNVNGLTRVGAYFGGDINGDGSSNFLD